MLAKLCNGFRERGCNAFPESDIPGRACDYGLVTRFRDEISLNQKLASCQFEEQGDVLLGLNVTHLEPHGLHWEKRKQGLIGKDRNIALCQRKGENNLRRFIWWCFSCKVFPMFTPWYICRLMFGNVIYLFLKRDFPVVNSSCRDFCPIFAMLDRISDVLWIAVAMTIRCDSYFTKLSQK